MKNNQTSVHITKGEIHQMDTDEGKYIRFGEDSWYEIQGDDLEHVAFGTWLLEEQFDKGIANDTGK